VVVKGNAFCRGGSLGGETGVGDLGAGGEGGQNRFGGRVVNNWRGTVAIRVVGGLCEGVRGTTNGTFGAGAKWGIVKCSGGEFRQLEGACVLKGWV